GIVAGPADVGAPNAAISVHRLLSAQDVGYLGPPPVGPKIDGGFAEWTSPTPDPALDTSGPADPDVDLTAFGTLPSANETFFFARVTGRFLAGTWVPEGT